MPKSMTAFAQGEYKAEWGTLRAEMRAVNHRYLDLTLQLPEKLKVLENPLRDLIRPRVQRGKLNLSLTLELEQGGQGQLEVDADLAQAYLQACTQLAEQIKGPIAPFNPMDILRSPGVLGTPRELPDAVADRATVLVGDVLENFIATRAREGEALKALVLERVAEIGNQVDEVEKAVPAIREALEQRLRKRLTDLNIEANPERLEQELVFQAQRMDVDEEIDRLRTHLNEIRLQLDSKEPIGRRLDFLAQELNREANTLASKSQGAATSQGAIEIKVCIEQIREQIQNIE